MAILRGLKAPVGIPIATVELLLTSQPGASFMQRIEGWFYSPLPIEGEV